MVRLTSLFMGKTDESQASGSDKRTTKRSTDSHEGFNSLLDRMNNKSTEVQQEYKPREKSVRKKEKPTGNEAMVREKENSDVNDEKKAKRTETHESGEGDRVSRKKSQERNRSNETEKKETTSVVAEDGTIDEDKLLQKLSEAFNLPVSQILDSLNDLGMLPAELVDEDKMLLFTQNLLQVTSPIELLQIPQIKQMITDANSILADVKEASEQVLGDSAKQNASKAVMPEMESTDSQPEESMADLLAQRDNQSNTSTSNQPLVNQPIANTVGNMETMVKAAAVEMVNGVNELGGASHNQTTTTTGFVENLSKTQTTSNVNPRDIIEQMVERIKVDARNSVTEIKITLRPEHLGDVTMKIAYENGKIIAHFVAESQRIKEIIESNFNELKDTLEQQGIDISELQVSVGQDQNDQMQQFLQEQERSAQRILDILEDVNGEPEEDVQDGLSSVNYTA